MKKFLHETHPEIVKEWHPTKNTIKPSQVTYGSDKKVWWLCSKDSRHEWFAKVNNRARRGIGCPVCAGKLVIAGVNDMATTHPELAAEWDPEKNLLPATGVVAGSGKKAYWICSTCNYGWYVSPNGRTSNNSGCPLCAGQVVVAGRNDLATTHQGLTKEWHQTKNTFTPEQVSRGSKKYAWWLCQYCGNEWRASIVRRASKGSGCPSCAARTKRLIVGENDLATCYPDLTKEWSQNNHLMPQDYTNLSNTIVEWVCLKGHAPWSTNIYHRTGDKPTGCPECGNRIIGEKLSVPEKGKTLADIFPALVGEWHPTLNTQSPTQVSWGSSQIVWWRCKMGHDWQTSIKDRTGKKNGCPYCSRHRVVLGESDLATTHPHLVAEWHPTKNGDKSPHDYVSGSGKRVWWQCEKGHEWETAIAKRAQVNGTQCRRCAMVGTSRAEQEVYALVQALVPDAKLHDRSIAPNYEYDISVPSKKIAIEYNGIYWHSEEFKPRNYHKDKSEAARGQGWQVITVWEDDWLNKRQVVEKMLAHKLGVSNQPKYNARSLTTNNITSTQARDFLDENHIQGAVGGSIRLGLYTTQPNPTLVAVMLFKVRSHQEKTFELVRYATSGIVRGGFSKLFKHFIREHQPKTVISFSDFEVSDGSLYTNNGFVQEGHLAPDYMYVANNMREHKFNYRKNRFKNDPHLIYDSGLTERQLAELNDIPRVYDSGKTKWVWYN